MHRMSETYIALMCVVYCMFAVTNLARAQSSIPFAASRANCAAILSDSRAGLKLTGSLSDSVRMNGDTANSRARFDTSSFGVGGARDGPADIILRVGVHADQVRFAKQPDVRVRLCWGGDTLRVVQRQNLPSPVVAGTTYRNVYVEVELVGRLNGECLSNALGIGNASQAGSRAATAVSPQVSGSSAAGCAFIGGTAGAGGQTPRPPTP